MWVCVWVRVFVCAQKKNQEQSQTTPKGTCVTKNPKPALLFQRAHRLPYPLPPPAPNLPSAPARRCVGLCFVGVHCSSKICLSVQANLYLLGKCVSVCVDVCVCVCGCVGVLVCVQKQHKEPRLSLATTTRVNDNQSGGLKV